MKPLIVLLATMLLSLLTTRLVTGTFRWGLSGRIAMSVMLLFTAVAHFVFTNGMAMMLPAFVPFKTTIVYSTGIIEILAAVGLLLPSLRRVTAWLLIVFFIVILPANIYAALHHIAYQTGDFDGNGPAYLWFRLPLQLFFIGWVYFSGIYQRPSTNQAHIVAS